MFLRSPKEDVQDFELNIVTFGVNCAPYLAILTLHQLADDCESDHQFASQILRNQTYVDDILAGSHSFAEATRKRDEIIHVLNSAGFSFRKWTSNDRGRIEDLPPDHLLDSQFLKLSDASTAKTLGLRWNASIDAFFL